MALIPVILVFIPLFLENNILIQADLYRILEPDMTIAWNIALWLMIVLFFVQFIREIVKDMQDREGDAKFGVQSVIVKYGERKTKRVIYILTFCLMALVLGFQIINLQSGPLAMLVGVTLLVNIPLIYFLVELKKASIVQDYGFLADLLNIIFISVLFTTFFVRNIILCGSIA